MYREDKLAEIKAALDEWEAENHHEFQKERKKEFLTLSGIPLKRLYTPLDLAQKGFDYLRDLGFPGNYPFVRGITPTMYRSELWKVQKYTGYPTPEESNKAWKAQVAAGQEILSIAYDLPSQLGYDPGHPMAEGEVGRVGVSLSSQRDWEIALDGINVRVVVIGQVFNALAAVGLANHLCIAEKQGVNFRELRGTIQNDILKEFVARGNCIFPPAPSMRFAIDVLHYCAQHLPKYQGMWVCSYHYAEAGATPIHEAAFALATVSSYLQAAIDRGIAVDAIAPSITFFTATRAQAFFEEIAKLRAMKRLHAKIMKERFKAQRRESMVARWICSATGSSFHKEQYLNNIARSAIAAMAGCLSGIQQQSSKAYDEQFGIPTPEATITAIRVQQILSRESGIADTIDPLAGSYFVESLTSEFEERLTTELDNIEKQGGMMRCIENGYVRRVIARDAYEQQKAFERGDVPRVGVNCFVSETEDRPVRIYRAAPDVEEQRIAAIKELKQKRDNQKVKKALNEIKAVASLEATAENNLVPPIIEAVKCYATVGEIADALREVWGEFREASIL